MATLTTTPIKTFVSGETVTPTKLNELSQSTVALTAGTIVAGDIAANAVTTAKILNANVTTAKILDANVTTAKIADANVTTAKIADANVTTAKIADANVTAAKLNGAQTGSAPIFGARAFVRFNGTRDTTNTASTANTNRLINASGNVSSVTRNGVGGFQINFATAMPDNNYTAVVTGLWSGGPFLAAPTVAASYTAAGLQVQTGNSSTGVGADISAISVAIFR